MNLRFLLNYDFRHTAINQLWRLISGPLLLLFIPLYLSAETQGYWYTFVSLAALAVFADMGFSAVLMLFSAHEFAHLDFNEDTTLRGDARQLSRIATLWLFAMKWSVLMAFLVFPLVLLIGFYMLSGKATSVNWLYPWIIYGSASVLVFLNSMLLSFIEGCDSVGDIQKIRFKIGLVNVSSTLILLSMGADLYALAFSLMFAALIGSAVLLKKYRKMFVQLYVLAQQSTHQWLKEIMPLIWRYSLSWVSGYFIISLFAPLAFRYYTPVEAGQVGLSVAVCAAIFGVSNMWISVVTPKINMYVARKQYVELDRVFFRHLMLAAATFISGAVLLYIILVYFNNYIPLGDRLVEGASLVLLVVGWFIQLLVNSFAVYMRAFKRESLVLPSILNGLYVGLSTLLIAMYFPFNLFFIGFFTAYLWVLPWVIYLFLKYKSARGGYAV